MKFSITLLVLLAGCAGTPTGDKVAKFATEYCDLSLTSRFAVRSQANGILQAEAASHTPPNEPAYVCFDCPGEGDECTDRSK